MIFWINCVLIFIVLVSMLIGFKRGFFRELLLTIILLIAFYVAIVHGKNISYWFNWVFGGEFLSVSYATAISFIGIIWIATRLMRRMRRKVFKTKLHGLIDRIIGLVFGLLRGLLVVICIIAFNAFSLLFVEDSWKSAFVVEQLNPLSSYFKSKIPEKSSHKIDDKIKEFDQREIFQKVKKAFNKAFGWHLSVLPELSKTELHPQASSASKTQPTDNKVNKNIYKDPRTIESMPKVKKKTDRDILLELQRKQKLDSQQPKTPESDSNHKV